MVKKYVEVYEDIMIFRLTSDLKFELSEIAKNKYGVTTSELLRNIIQEWLLDEQYK